MELLAANMNAFVMGFFLSLSVINVWENSRTFIARKRKLDALQWVASIAQIINLILHMILDTATGLPCVAMAWIETSSYYILQVSSTYVIIYRATAVIRSRNYRYLLRAVFGLLQVVSLGFNMASTILMDNEVVDGICTPIYELEYNNICNIFLAVLYIGLLITFCVPIIRNIWENQLYIKSSALKDVVVITAIKINIAILAEVLTTILSLLGVFGDYFWIQFTIENYALVWASTVASRRTQKETHTGITHIDLNDNTGKNDFSSTSSTTVV